MARGVNKVILVCTIGKDPEVKYMPNGGVVANVTAATSEKYKDKNTGQDVEKTEWHRIVFFGKLAEIVGEYLRKGSRVYVEGKLQTRKWQDQQGQDKYTTEIVVDGFSGQMQMLGGKDNNQNQTAPQGGFNQPQQQGGFNQGQSQGQQVGFAPQKQSAPAQQDGYNPQPHQPQGGMQQPGKY